MSQANAAGQGKSRQISDIAEQLHGIRILLVGPSLDIMGGQAVQLDLLRRNLSDEGVDAEFLPINPVPWGPLKYLTKIKYVRTAIVSVFYISSLLWRVRKFDVIHVFSASYFSFIIAPTPAILIAKLFRKRVVLNYRSGEAEDHFNRWGKLVFWIIKSADRIVVPSRYLVDVFAKFGFEAEYIYNISDFESFRFREREKTDVIIVPRNLEPLYDIETAIRAFVKVHQEYPSTSLVIVGAGSDEKRLHELVAKEQLPAITFTGRVERTKMSTLLDEADVFLNTSLIDNMPVAIVEAYYCGLPVVTTDAGGIPYIVENEVSGLVVSKRDVDAVAAALCKVISDGDCRKRIVAGGQTAAKQFRWEAVREKWAQLYSELAGEHG